MRTAALILAGVLGVLGLVWVLQGSLIYFPSEHLHDIGLSLRDGEEVTLRTGDGLILGGWYVPGGDEGTVIVFNGNAGNRSHRVLLATGLADHGYSVLLFDYRGYGGNPGRPSEEGLALDAAAARAYLDSRDDVDPERVVYFGESLGAAVALRLASDHPPAALVLRSPFTSLADVGAAHYPLLPVSLLLRDRYQNVDAISRLAVPLMVVAGTRDSIVPREQSQRLHDEAAAEHKRLLLVEADHNDPELGYGNQMLTEVAGFLDTVLR